MESDAATQGSSRKRQRRHSQSSVDVIWSTKCWLSDGNLVLQVNQTQFRVHKSVLARHSPVLQDMLGLPQPCEDEATVEGCPIVYLSDDAMQWELLLGVLYDGLHAFSGEVLPFGLVAAMLQLGDKYQFEALKERALRCLSKQFPDKMEDFRFALGNTMREGKPHTVCFLDHDHSFHDVVNLAINLRLDRILPSLYLQALMRRCSSLPMFYTGTSSASGRITNLSPDAQKLLGQSHGRLAVAVSKNQLAWLRNGLVPTAECPSPRACQQSLLFFTEEFWIPTISLAKAFMPVIKDNLLEYFCTGCASVAEEQFEAGKVATWSKLPEFFGLPPWEKLENFAFHS